MKYERFHCILCEYFNETRKHQFSWTSFPYSSRIEIEGASNPKACQTINRRIFYKFSENRKSINNDKMQCFIRLLGNYAQNLRDERDFSLSYRTQKQKHTSYFKQSYVANLLIYVRGLQFLQGHMYIPFFMSSNFPK